MYLDKFDNYFIHEDVAYLPNDLEELVEALGLELDETIYEDDNFSQDELLTLEHLAFYDFGEIYTSIFENDSINENANYKKLDEALSVYDSDSLLELDGIVFEKVGENKFRKRVRVTTKLLIRKLKRKYKELMAKLNKKAKNDASNAKTDKAKKGIFARLKAALTKLKNWFLEKLGLLKKKQKQENTGSSKDTTSSKTPELKKLTA